jgi:16S rRNA U516 pseudouridylate synthase RsuA-like enzyme
MSEPIQRTLTVPVEYAGQRLDQVLAELLSDFSRTRIKEWIEAGQVLVDGEKLRPKDKVLGGEQVRVSGGGRGGRRGRGGADRAGRRPQDRHIFVLNKPPGWSCIRAPATRPAPCRTHCSIWIRSSRKCRGRESCIGSTRIRAG